MFNDEVQHGAAAVRPCGKVKCDAVGGDFDKLVGGGDDRFVTTGPGVQIVWGIAGTNAEKYDNY